MLIKNIALTEQATAHKSELQFLADTARELSHLEDIENIYTYIGEKLHFLLGKNIVTVISSLNQDKNMGLIEAIYGIKKFQEDILNIINRNPVGMKFELKPEFKHLLETGKIKEYPRDISSLSQGSIPPSFANKITKLLNIRNIYTIGLGNYGSVSIIMRKHQTLKNKDLAEAFLSQASVALQNKIHIDELGQTKNKIEKASLAKSEFFSHISHDLRSPLNGIIGFSSMLMRDLVDPQKNKYATLINNLGETLLETVNDIMDISKLHSGSYPIVESSFNLVETLQKITEEYSLEATTNNIKLNYIIDPHIPTYIITDKNKFERIIRNLIGNAIKFTNNGYVKITIYTSNRNSKSLDLTILVEDSGKGMTAEELEKIWGAFNQANTEIHEQFGGTGLGLTISKLFTELLDGNISVKSNQNFGTTFTVIIPVIISSDIETPREKIELNHKEIISLQPLKILIADDDKITGMVTKLNFKELNQTPKLVKSGEEILEELKLKSYDLIMLDINMPGMSGFQTAEKIRSMGIRVPIIALSSSIYEDDIKRSFKSGMNDFISRPIRDTNSLAKSIANLLNIDNKFREFEIPTSNNLLTTKENSILNQILNYFQQELQADADFLQKVSEESLKSMTNHVQVIEKALDQQDFKTILDETHGMGSMLETVKIDTYAKIARKIELLARIAKEAFSYEIKTTADASILSITNIKKTKSISLSKVYQNGNDNLSKQELLNEITVLWKEFMTEDMKKFISLKVD